jgi:hypothetical protein
MKDEGGDERLVIAHFTPVRSPETAASCNAIKKKSEARLPVVNASGRLHVLEAKEAL